MDQKSNITDWGLTALYRRCIDLQVGKPNQTKCLNPIADDPTVIAMAPG